MPSSSPLQKACSSVQLYHQKPEILELELAAAAEPQMQAPRLLPVLKRRTRALPSVTLEEGERAGITCTGTEPGEEEQGLAEGIPVWSHDSHALHATEFAYANVNTC